MARGTHDNALEVQQKPQADRQQDRLDRHTVEDVAGNPPRLARQVVPSQQKAYRQDRQEEVLAEAQGVDQLPHPNVGPVPQGARAQQQDPRLVDHQQRRNEDETGQRLPRPGPIAGAGGRESFEIGNRGHFALPGLHGRMENSFDYSNYKRHPPPPGSSRWGDD